MYTDHQLRNFKNRLFRTDNTRPFLRLKGNNTTISFTSLHSCSEFLNVEAEVIWGAFVRQEMIKEWTFSYIPFNDREAVYAKTYAGVTRPLACRQSNQKRPVKIVDITTGAVSNYESVRYAGEMIHINNKNILASISTPNKVRLLYERYVVVDEAQSLDFLTQDICRGLLAKIRLGVAVLDVKTNTVQKFSSLSFYLRRYMNVPDVYAAYQRHLRLKTIVVLSNRYYIVRLTPSLIKMSEIELGYHIQKLRREKNV